MSLILPYIENNEYNRFGFYTVGQARTYSKYEAFQLSQSLGIPVQWNFNDQVYSGLDWTDPGPHSLNELYRMRAEQLRERYDYLILAYSGGADSHNVLMSFVKNNIHLDEIMHITELEGDKDPMSFANAEVTRVAYPTAKEIIDTHGLKTRHRVIDLSDIILNLWKWVSDEEWKHFLRFHFYPINLARGFIREKTPDYQRLTDQGLKIGIIWGADKPNLVGLRHSSTGVMAWAVAFSDRNDGMVNGRQASMAQVWGQDEYFYWAPDAPNIVKVQAHVLVSYMKQSLRDTTSWQSGREITDAGCCVQSGQWVYLKKDTAHALIYPYWNPLTFSVGKPTSLVFGDRDRWLFADKSHNTMQTFLSAIRKLQKSSQWIDVAQGGHACWSRIYPLEKIDNLQNWEIKYPY